MFLHNNGQSRRVNNVRYRDHYDSIRVNSEKMQSMRNTTDSGMGCTVCMHVKHSHHLFYHSNAFVFFLWIGQWQHIELKIVSCCPNHKQLIKTEVRNARSDDYGFVNKFILSTTFGIVSTQLLPLGSVSKRAKTKRKNRSILIQIRNVETSEKFIEKIKLHRHCEVCN